MKEAFRNFSTAHLFYKVTSKKKIKNFILKISFNYKITFLKQMNQNKLILNIRKKKKINRKYKLIKS